MAEDRYIRQDFPIKCRGRDANGNEVLSAPISAILGVSQFNGNETSIELSVICPYNTGGHGQRCCASHPETDKVGKGVMCPYSADIPYAFDSKNHQ